MKNHPTVVQIVHIDDVGDSCHRMRWPAVQLSEHAPDWRILNVHARAKERYEWALHADLLVLFQCSDIDMLAVLRKRKSQGKKTLVEYNDHFYAPQPWSPVVEGWNSPLIWQTYEAFIREADGLLVTGPGLLSLFEKKIFNANSCVRKSFSIHASTDIEADGL